MSASPLMMIGVKALAANYAALQTTGHNLANVNVSGYSRQTVELATSQGQFTGAGFFGRGVDVATVSRAHDKFLTSEATNAKSLAAMDSARLSHLQRLEKLFQNGEGSIGDGISQLFAAVSDLSTSPNDLSARQVVLGRARDLAAGFRSTVSGLDSVQAGVTAALTSSVADVNSLAQSIAQVNQQIAAQQGLGQQPNDLLDQREALISKLSEQVQVTRMNASDGTMSLFIGGGQTLVLGTLATPLQVTQVPDPTDPSRQVASVQLVPGGTLDATGTVIGGQPRTLDATSFGGGAIRGLLDFQDNDLAQARQSVNDLAVAIRDAFNGQQAAGFDLDGNPGGLLFDPSEPAATMKLADAMNARGIAASSVVGLADSGNNQNALEMLKLQDLGFNSTWIEVTAKVGVQVQGASIASDMSAAVADQAEQARSSQAGVNLDEEAARLIQFQQSYQAAAKVLQVAQSLFDTLLQTAGR
jgi:flagellar hook-associated protein 1 FlgK